MKRWITLTDIYFANNAIEDKQKVFKSLQSDKHCLTLMSYLLNTAILKGVGEGKYSTGP